MIKKDEQVRAISKLKRVPFDEKKKKKKKKSAKGNDPPFFGLYCTGSIA